MDLRSDDCPYPDSLWLNGDAGRLCICCLPEKERHPGSKIFNTHVFCFQGLDPLKINSADMSLIMGCLGSGLKDVVDHDLYDCRHECGVDDDAIDRLIVLLQGAKQKNKGELP